MKSFVPSAEQQRIIDHRGGHLQVIACAGAGKTEAIARRVAALLEDGAEPQSIVAFTFTERAAASLKERILERGLGVGARSALLSQLYVGTIHAYCWRLLQEHGANFGNVDLLTDHRLAALLSREHHRLGLSALAPKHWQGVYEFLRHADVVENELLAEGGDLPGPFGTCYREYRRLLAEYHALTFGTIIAEAVACLRRPELGARVVGPLRYVIVDEYQDVNPAQDELIRLLARSHVSLCVVADDDQSIYQWRGADVDRLLGFGRKFSGTTSLHLSVNRRSRPAIIQQANSFAQSISPRLAKSMEASRPASQTQIHPWMAPSPEAEAVVLASTIAELRDQGYRYQDIAILYRSVRNASGPVVAELRRRGMPCHCAGLNGLFLAKEASALAKVYSWLANAAWRETRGSKGQRLDLNQLAYSLCRAFGDAAARSGIASYLDDWYRRANDAAEPVHVLKDYYALLGALGVSHGDLADSSVAERCGTAAHFAAVLADFELIARRSRLAASAGTYDAAGRGGQIYFRLYHYLQYYAFDAYEGFAAEASGVRDRIAILTVHQAKGLEWPVVFLPSLVHGRFPAKAAGKKARWLLPESVFPQRRSVSLRGQ